MFSFETDEDTVRLFEIVVWNLERFFGLSNDEAITAVNEFYARFATLWPDDFYHEEMPFRVAARMYFVVVKKGANSEFANWIRGSKWERTPIEASDYFRETFFDNDRPTNG